MQISAIETLHADGGWRVLSYVRITTDTGLVGWSEYSEAIWSPGLTPVIRALAPFVIGKDPQAFARLSADLHAATRMVAGGLAHQAVGAIENACLDLAGKAAGMPVYRLFGGPVRDRIPLYWSHCGSFRASRPDVFERLVRTPPLRSLDDFKALGAELRASGYRAAKTNPIVFGPEGGRMLNPGFVPGQGLDLSGSGADFPTGAIVAQIEALRDGAGPDIELMLDLNFSLSGDGILRVARTLDHLGLSWFEIDTPDHHLLAEARARLRTPVASCESMHGVRQYRPFLETRAVDTALIDVAWNGLNESLRIASLANAFSTNVTPHNCYGRLATRINAHFAALVPNCRIMEIEVDDVPWHTDLVAAPQIIEDGRLVLDDAPGWGCVVNEDAIRAHPVTPDPARPWLC